MNGSGFTLTLYYTMYSEGRASDLVRSYDNMWKVILLPETFLTSQVVYESPKNDNFRSIEAVGTFWRHFEGSCSK